MFPFCTFNGTTYKSLIFKNMAAYQEAADCFLKNIVPFCLYRGEGPPNTFRGPPYYKFLPFVFLEGETCLKYFNQGQITLIELFMFIVLCIDNNIGKENFCVGDYIFTILTEGTNRYLQVHLITKYNIKFVVSGLLKDDSLEKICYGPKLYSSIVSLKKEVDGYEIIIQNGIKCFIHVGLPPKGYFYGMY